MLGEVDAVELGQHKFCVLCACVHSRCVCVGWQRNIANLVGYAATRLGYNTRRTHHSCSGALSLRICIAYDGLSSSCVAGRSTVQMCGCFVQHRPIDLIRLLRIGLTLH